MLTAGAKEKKQETEGSEIIIGWEDLTGSDIMNKVVTAKLGN